MSRRAVASLEGQGPLMEHVADRVAAIRRQQLTDLQLKLFPDWPDDRRGAPNPVIRSAIFGVVRRGRRKFVKNMPVAGPPGWNITLTGWRLDQHDCDLWLEVMHLARNGKPGEEVRFTIRSMLKRLGYTTCGKRDYVWLQERLRELVQTTISFESEREVGAVGSMIAAFRVDRKTGEGVAHTNPHIRPLFESVTHLDIEQRRALGQNQLAKALHAALSSHVEWLPMRLSTLMQRVGAEYGRLRDFKSDLKAVLEDFQARGWVRGYSFTPRTDGELVAIDKFRTPTQVRAIEKRQLAAPAGTG